MKHFCKSALTAFLVIMLVGVTVGCGDQTQEERGINARDIQDELANAQGGATAADPVPLTLDVSFSPSNWEAILSAVHAVGKTLRWTCPRA